MGLPHYLFSFFLTIFFPMLSSTGTEALFSGGEGRSQGRPLPGLPCLWAAGYIPGGGLFITPPLPFCQN